MRVLIYRFGCNIDRIRTITDRVAIVTYKGDRAGLLSEAGPDTRFVYDPDWNRAIACAFPAETRDFTWRGGLFPFFEHLGPEGWLRGRQARAGRTANEDDLGLLLTHGADCIGAVGILPIAGPIPLNVPHDGGLEEAAGAARRTLSGVQKKLLAYRNQKGFTPAIARDDPATHIAKFNQPDEPTLVQNEDLSLTLARELLGPEDVTAAAKGVVNGIDGIALLVERFDRQGEVRLRLEDFAQILGIGHGRNFEGKYRSSYEHAAEAISRHSVRARIDLLRYYRLVVFNVVIGNADAHLKNFSLLETGDGLRLSPAYDLLCTLLYPYNDETALEIGGRKRPIVSVERTHLLQLAADIGLPDRVAASALDHLARRFARAQTLSFAAPVEANDFRARYKAIVDGNAKRIFA